MEVSNASPPHAYVTAPNSPNAQTSMDFYYSAPTTPRRRTGCGRAVGGSDHLTSNLDDFEFETSKHLSDPVDCNKGDDDSDCDDGDGRTYPRERGGSLPAMAFADELFLNGLVMPLKLPPRLQYDTDSNSFSQKSPVSSSPRTVCRLPFARSAWNDDFDPFLVALKKVREENRGRNSVHRRSRSYSPFRGVTKGRNYGDQENNQMEEMEKPAPRYSGPLDFKGSAYARFVIDQTREGLNPKSPNRFLLGPLKPEKEKPVSPKCPEKKCGEVEESKVQKVKGFLLRYASFRKGNSGSKALIKASSDVGKLSYFSRLSFKFKGNGHKKRNAATAAADTEKAVVQYKPSFALCLGYGAASPRLLN